MITGTVIGLIGGALVTLLFSALWSTPFEHFTQNVGSVVSVIGEFSTVVLVVITAVYVVYTGKLVSETKKARKQEVRPILHLDLVSAFAEVQSPRITNVGDGPAREIDIKLALEPDGPTEEIQLASLPDGESATYVGPAVSDLEKIDQIVMKGELKDVFDETHCVDEKIQLSVSYNPRIDRFVEDHPYSDQLEDISTSLESISDAVSSDEVQRLVKMRMRQPILSTLQRNGAMTVMEISREVGLFPVVTAITLSSMMRDGIVTYDIESEKLLDEDEFECVEIQLRN